MPSDKTGLPALAGRARMRVTLAGLTLLPFLCGGCFLGASEVGQIAGTLISAGLAQVKEETRAQVKEATTVALAAIEQSEANDIGHGTVAMEIAAALAALFGAKKLRDRSAKRK